MEKFPVCTHCGFTWYEYRARGLLGCPQCYAAFGDALQADLLWFHRALEHAAAPASSDNSAAPERIAALREQLASSLRKENYEEAARLRRLINGLG
jgi:protein arginine kinase activator